LVRVGVLALQGDFLEHVQILRELDGVKPVAVKRVDDLSSVDALIIPGGESTTIGSLIVARGLADKIASLAESGTPIMGTCAGAVLLAKSVSDKTVGPTDQFTLKLMNIEVVRNAYGRQRESFIADVDIDEIGRVRAAFIRAPEIKNAWPPARITGFIDYPGMGRVGVSAQQDSMLALAFHPEITGEKKVYEYFLRLVKA
jgi:5'-phosphate synthase pdxT subunit